MSIHLGAKIGENIISTKTRHYLATNSSSAYWFPGARLRQTPNRRLE